MLSTNMMSFMKKIVHTSTEEDNEQPKSTINNKKLAAGSDECEEQKVRWRSPPDELTQLTAEERSIIEKVWQKEEEFEKETMKISSGGSHVTKDVCFTSNQEHCRICRKVIREGEESRKCDICGQPVCVDCASYYKDSNDDNQWWKCSFCRRRQGQDRLGLEPPPGSGMQRVPSVRRMTQRMGQLRREESVLVPELSVDLEEKIDLEGGPPRSLKKGRSGKVAGESERSFSLEERHSIGINPNDKNREKNHVIHLRTSHDSRSPVDRQKSLESSSKIRKSSTPERSVSHHEDEYLSLDAALERRYSFEYRRNPTGHALYSDTYSGNSHQHRNNFHYSSVSVDECVHEDFETKQKQIRITKRSRFQRQKYCIEEPDSGPTLNRPGIQTQSAVEPTLTSRRIFGGSVEAINKCTSYILDHSNETPTSTGVSSVPGQQNSDSSHPDGIGAKLSPLNNRELEDYDPYYAFERLTMRKTTKKLQKSRRHTIDLDKNYEVNLTRTPNGSPEEYVYVNKPHSLDDHEVYCYSTLRRNIPSIFVNTVSDNDPPSQPYLHNKDPPRRNSTGRALPHVPVPANLLGVHSFPSECNFTIHSLDLSRDEKGRIDRRASAPERDNIELVIDDVNCESQHVFRQKKVLLHRDQRDTEAGSRDFGMSLTGGKSTDGAGMYPTVAWTRPGGLADLKGIYQGDRILEWGGVTLVDRTLEEVSDIIERTGDNVEVVIELDNGKANENQSRSPHSSHHTVTWSSISPRSPTLALLPNPSNIQDVQPVSPTRRKLPRTPTQPPKPISLGEIAIRLWFDDSRSDLQVTLLSAKGLRRMKTPGNSASTFAKLRLVPQSGFGTKETQMAELSTNPKWNETFVFPSVSTDELLDKSLEVTVWDESPAGNKTLIGGTEIQFQKTDFRDCPEWYPLTSCQPPPLSPSLIQKIQHRSVSGDDVIARKAVNETGQESVHTFSDDKEDQYKDEEKHEITKSSSIDFTFFPSEDAWDQIQQRPTDGGSGNCVEATNATRLLPNKKTSLQLPTRDDSSDFHVKPKDQERNTSVHSNKSCTSDSEKAENLAGPTHKSTTRKTKLPRALSQRSDVDDKSVVLVETLGEIKLGFLLTKGQLEVEVFCACQLPLSSLGQPPDTYIKTYLKEGEKQMQKRKTRIVRSTSSPQYHQTLKYGMSDIQGRHLLVMVWERQKGFDHNHPMGTVEIELGRLDLSKSMICWYPLYPLPSHNPDSCVSP